MYCVDLGESFQTHICLQNLDSIQARTSPVKFARSEPPLARESTETHEARRLSEAAAARVKQELPKRIDTAVRQKVAAQISHLEMCLDSNLLDMGAIEGIDGLPFRSTEAQARMPGALSPDSRVCSLGCKVGGFHLHRLKVDRVDLSTDDTAREGLAGGNPNI